MSNDKQKSQTTITNVKLRQRFYRKLIKIAVKEKVRKRRKKWGNKRNDRKTGEQEEEEREDKKEEEDKEEEEEEEEEKLDIWMVVM